MQERSTLEGISMIHYNFA